MPLPSLRASAEAPAALEVDVLVVAIGSADDTVSVHAAGIDGEALRFIDAAVTQIGADGSVDGLWRIPAPDYVAAQSVLLVGMGSAAPGPDTLRAAAGAALRGVATASSIGLALPSSSPEEAAAIAEGALIGAHRVLKHGQESSETAREIVIIGELTSHQLAAAERAAAAVWLVRDLVNSPPNVLTPATFVERIAEEARDLPLTLEVLDEQALREQGYGGISAVGQGSVHPPRLLVLRYRPGGSNRHVALVGKGITFDSGGLSLKPPGSMVGMKYDMTGAAVVSAVALAAARAAGPTAVSAWVCLAENMPSGSAIRPNDVITIKGGTTVEVLNTDAEGRLVMADAIAAASEESPDLIVDIATLTGAARIALGERYAGLMGSDDAVEAVTHAARVAGELVWPMPLPEELRALLKTDVADIANAKPGNTLGGMLLAGVFLREFVGKAADGSPLSWAHLDIAGPASNSSSGYGYTPQGPTGALTRTLLALVDGAGGEGA